EQGERDARRTLGGPLGGSALHELEAAVAAERLEAGFDRPVALRYGLDADAHPGPVVGREPPLRIGDGDSAAALRIARLHLRDLPPGGPGGLVAGAQQVGLALRRDVGGND